MATETKQTGVEREGTVRSSLFQHSKSDVVNHLQAAIESFLASRNMSQETLAETICGMSRPNFSKVSRGQQGDILELIFEKLPGEIRDDFLGRLTAAQHEDALLRAVEQTVQSAFTALRLAGLRNLPSRASHMAHVEIESRTEKRA